MTTQQSKMVVIGAGAIGGITAACLKKAGRDVAVVCKYPELAEKIKTRGLHVTGVKGDFFAAMPAVAQTSDLDGKKDVVFLATKAAAIQEAAQQLLPFLHEDSAVVSLQNGICEPALAEIIGPNRVIGCVVGWGATMLAPGELEMTSQGEFVIGNLDGRRDDRLPQLQEIMNDVLPTFISENILGSLYSKLIVNACITSLGAVCGLYLGEMLAIRKVRNIFQEIMREAMAVAGAMNLKVEKYAGKLDYDKLTQSSGFISNLRMHLLIRMIGFKYRRLKSSSLQSLERGQKTEIDYLNGFICREGKRYHIPTPVNDRIVALIKEIEAGKRKITVDNFADAAFASFD